MKTTCWMLALLLSLASAASAASPQQPAADLAAQTRDFERNTELGEALSERAGTQAELDELRTLAQRGLAQARTAVSKSPNSPEASYLLGSWLLYGYRVWAPEGAVGPPQVVQGLADAPDEGLAALKKASELAPKRGDYYLDHAAALFDCGMPYEAMQLLNKAWAGQPQLTQTDKMRAGLLLSNIHAFEGRYTEARRWAYAALEVNRDNAEIIARLRHLDAAEAAAPALLAEEFPAQEAPAGEEGWEEPSEEEYYEEGYGEESEEWYEDESGEYYEEEYDEGYEEGFEGEAEYYEEGYGEDSEEWYEDESGEYYEEEYEEEYAPGDEEYWGE